MINFTARRYKPADMIFDAKQGLFKKTVPILGKSVEFFGTDSAELCELIHTTIELHVGRHNAAVSASRAETRI